MSRVELLEEELTRYREKLRESPSTLFETNVELALVFTRRLEEITPERIHSSCLISYEKGITLARDFRLKHMAFIAFDAAEGSGFWRGAFYDFTYFMDGLVTMIERNMVRDERDILERLETMIHYLGIYLKGRRLDDQREISVDNLPDHEFFRELLDLYIEEKRIFLERDPIVQPSKAERQQERNDAKSEENRQKYKMGNFSLDDISLTDAEHQLFELYFPFFERYSLFITTYRTEIATLAIDSPGFRDIHDNLSTAAPLGIIFEWNRQGRPDSDKILGFWNNIVTTWVGIIEPYLEKDTTEDRVVKTAPDHIHALAEITFDAVGLLFELEG